jgi:tetratricopeptide (TPR) repeat protein
MRMSSIPADIDPMPSPRADFERRIHAFEDAWFRGQPPEIGQFVRETGRFSLQLLSELALIDCEFRVKSGEKIVPEEYLARYPELGGQPELMAQLHRTVERHSGHTAILPSRPTFHEGSSRSQQRCCPHCGAAVVTDPTANDSQFCCRCGGNVPVEELTPLTSGTELPTTIGRYMVRSLLGRGTFGNVYLAYDPARDLLVAIKTPRSGIFRSTEEEERFLREPRSAARLHHPHIVQIYDILYDRGVPAIVSEYIVGGTLADRLRDARPAVPDAVRLIRRVADALSCAHREKITHRDVKPANILMDAAGEPHLTDFGLARRDEADVTMTMAGQVLGTPAYMSPEQARGDQAQVGPASDLYSLGVVFYELLTGELPFRGASRMVMRQVMEDDPRSPRSLNDLVPADLETICLKCLAKDPPLRYATCSQLDEDLARWERGEPILARPTGRVERIQKWVRRNRTVTALAAAVFVVLLLGIAISGYLAIAKDRSAKQAFAAKNQAEEMLKRFARMSALWEQMVREFDPMDLDNPLNWGKRPAPPPKALIERLHQAEQFVEELADLPEQQARMLYTMGRTYRSLAEYDRAMPLLERAMSIHRASPDGVAPDEVNTLVELGRLYREIGQGRKAGELLEVAVEASRQIAYVPAGTWSDPEFHLAWACADQARDDGQSWSKAIDLFSKVADRYEETRGNGSVEYALAISGLGFSRIGRGGEQYLQAITELNTGMAILENQFHPREQVLTKLFQSYLAARFARDKQNWQDSERHYRGALEICKSRFGESHPITLLLIGDFAGMLNASGMPEKRDEAERLIRPALDFARSSMLRGHPEMIKAIVALADELRGRNSRDRLEAAQLYNEALGYSVHRWGETDGRTADIRNKLESLRRESAEASPP